MAHPGNRYSFSLLLIVEVFCTMNSKLTAGGEYGAITVTCRMKSNRGREVGPCHTPDSPGSARAVPTAQLFDYPFTILPASPRKDEPQSQLVKSRRIREGRAHKVDLKLQSGNIGGTRLVGTHGGCIAYSKLRYNGSHCSAYRDIASLTRGRTSSSSLVDWTCSAAFCAASCRDVCSSPTRPLAATSSLSSSFAVS